MQNGSCIYVDDVIIFSNNMHGQIKQVDEILTTLTDAGVPLKSSKWHYLQQNLE